jgi:hypothetical protein
MGLLIMGWSVRVIVWGIDKRSEEGVVQNLSVDDSRPITEVRLKKTYNSHVFRGYAKYSGVRPVIVFTEPCGNIAT